LQLSKFCINTIIWHDSLSAASLLKHELSVKWYYWKFTPYFWKNLRAFAIFSQKFNWIRWKLPGLMH